jgi:hypothetical protein
MVRLSIAGDPAPVYRIGTVAAQVSLAPALTPGLRVRRRSAAASGQDPGEHAADDHQRGDQDGEVDTRDP